MSKFALSPLNFLDLTDFELNGSNNSSATNLFYFFSDLDPSPHSDYVTRSTSSDSTSAKVRKDRLVMDRFIMLVESFTETTFVLFHLAPHIIIVNVTVALSL